MEELLNKESTELQPQSEVSEEDLAEVEAIKAELARQQKEVQEWDPRGEQEENDLHLEKNDRLAMWLAGLLTVGLPCLLLIALIIVITLLLFTR